MEAKDTVMPLEYSALDGLHCAGISDSKILRALKAQAEITWDIAYKAGHEKRESEFVYNPDYLDYGKGVKSGKLIGRQEGRKEVVDWTEREFGVDWSEETEQLKKWGIE